MRDYKEMYTASLGNPLVNQEQLTRLTFKNAYGLDEDELDKLIVDPKDIKPPVDDKEKSPGQIAFEAIAKSYPKAAPDIRAELEEKAGLDPSVTHEGSMEQLASEQFAATNQADPTTLDLEEVGQIRMPQPVEETPVG
jgi:hypothetical protein